jgi:hypothetical protein
MLKSPIPISLIATVNRHMQHYGVMVVLTGQQSEETGIDTIFVRPFNTVKESDFVTAI